MQAAEPAEAPEEESRNLTQRDDDAGGGAAEAP